MSADLSPAARTSPNGSSQTPAATDSCGEAGPVAAGTHGTWGAIKRHRGNVEPLCDDCREFARSYNRDYYRHARQIDTFRERHNQRRRESYRRLRMDAEHVERYREWQRNRRRHLRAVIAAEARVDEVAVERAIRGEPVRLNRDEKRAAIQQLLDRGYSLTEAARRLGLNYDYARKYAGVA